MKSLQLLQRLACGAACPVQPAICKQCAEGHALRNARRSSDSTLAGDIALDARKAASVPQDCCSFSNALANACPVPSGSPSVSTLLKVTPCWR